MDDKRLIAILSDYDGTLCPTSNINLQDPTSGFVPFELEAVLCNISSRIPMCIISSKDFYFLYKRVKKFSKIISCILGLETLVLSDREAEPSKQKMMSNDVFESTNDTNFFYLDNEIAVKSRHLLAQPETILEKSILLNKISNYLEFNYPSITIEKKFSTVGNDVLAGITIDWRNDNKQEWPSNAKKYSKIVKESILRISNKTHIEPQISQIKSTHYFNDLFIQEYSSHPFIDIYGISSDKGHAFDCVRTEIFDANQKTGKILYLGDSENDNPAFRLADVSIGIVTSNYNNGGNDDSSRRVKSSLDCKYFLDYYELPVFLNKLSQNNFEFQESLLN